MSELKDIASTLETAGKIAMSVMKKMQEAAEAKMGQSHMQDAIKTTVKDKDQGQGQ